MAVSYSDPEQVQKVADALHQFADDFSTGKIKTATWTQTNEIARRPDDNGAVYIAKPTGRHVVTLEYEYAEEVGEFLDWAKGQSYELVRSE